MSLQLAMIISASIKNVLAILCSMMLIYFGYRIFYLSESKFGDLEFDSKFGKVRIIHAAPGIFLSLFGAVILIFSLSNTSSFKDSGSGTEVTFGSVGVKPEKFNKICANSIHWALNAVRSSQDYINSTGPGRLAFDLEIGRLEAVIAECVDSELGSGYYGSYLQVQKRIDRGELPDVKDKNTIMHNSVSKFISG